MSVLKEGINDLSTIDVDELFADRDYYMFAIDVELKIREIIGIDDKDQLINCANQYFTGYDIPEKVHDIYSMTGRSGFPIAEVYITIPMTFIDLYKFYRDYIGDPFTLTKSKVNVRRIVIEE